MTQVIRDSYRQDAMSLLKDGPVPTRRIFAELKEITPLDRSQIRLLILDLLDEEIIQMNGLQGLGLKVLT